MSTNKFLDHLAILVRFRKLIMIITAATAISAIIYSLLTPQIWSSRATFLVIGDDQPLALNIGELGNLASMFLDTAAGAEGMNSVTILESRTFKEAVIRKFGLIEYFNISVPDSNRAMDIALIKMAKNVAFVGLNEETGLISVDIQTKNKQLSLDIAEHYLEKLEQYNLELKQTRGRLNRIFLENRIKQIRTDIDSLSLVLKEFQVKNKAIALNEQLESVVKLYSETISMQMMADVELELARSRYASSSPVVKGLEQKKAILAKKVTELEKSSDKLKPRYMLDIENIPDLAMRYAQIVLNLEIQKKLFEFIFPQYEMAKLEEQKDMPSLEIIDHPRLAGLRAKPKRAMLCVIATLIGFLLSTCVAAFVNKIEENREKVLALWNTFWGRKSTE